MKHFIFFTDLIHMERINLQYVGFVRVLSINQGLTTVKGVPIKKVSFTKRPQIGLKLES